MKTWVNELSSAWAVWPPTIHGAWISCYHSGLQSHLSVLQHQRSLVELPATDKDPHTLTHLKLLQTTQEAEASPQCCFVCHRPPVVPCCCNASVSVSCRFSVYLPAPSKCLKYNLKWCWAPQFSTGSTTFIFDLWYFCQWSLLLEQSFVVCSCKYLFTKNQNKISKWAWCWSKDVIFRSNSSGFSAFESQTQTEIDRLWQRFLPNSVKYIIYSPANSVVYLAPHPFCDFLPESSFTPHLIKWGIN